jgi:hypothetical protein
MCSPKAPHLILLVRFQFEIAAWLGRAQQHEPRLAILDEIRRSGGLIEFSLDEPGGARQAAPLVTDGGQPKTRHRRRVPDEFILSAMD